MDGITQPNKKTILKFFFCCHMVSFLLKTAIMQDSGCPYTSMKSGYEIVKKKYTIKFRLQQKISPMKKINELPSKFYLKNLWVKVSQFWNIFA